MATIVDVITKVAENQPLRIYHSQPLPRGYSTIAKAKRLVGASQIQMAFVNAVVKEGK
jgi:hypothetical protein